MFWGILALGLALIFMEGFLSYRDGYFSTRQLIRRGLWKSYSFTQSGAMWGDALFISPLVAWILSTQHLNFVSFQSFVVLVFVIALWVIMDAQYTKMGLVEPGWHSHDGSTTDAGIIHGIYAIPALWVIVLFYLTPITPALPAINFLRISWALMAFLVFSVTQFSHRYKYPSLAKIQLAVTIVLLWTVTLFKVWAH